MRGPPPHPHHFLPGEAAAGAGGKWDRLGGGARGSSGERPQTRRRVCPPPRLRVAELGFKCLTCRSGGGANFLLWSPYLVDPDSSCCLPNLPVPCSFHCLPRPHSIYSLTGAWGLSLRPRRQARGPVAALCTGQSRFQASHPPAEMHLDSSVPSQDSSQALFRASVYPSEKWGQVSLLEGLLRDFKEKCLEWACNFGSMDTAVH